MPEISPSVFTSLRRGAVGFGRALRPAIGPLAIGAGVYLGFEGLSGAIDSYAAQQNPPAQVGLVPTGPPGPDGQPSGTGYFFDPRTGRTSFFGQPSTGGNGPERSEERVDKTLIIGAAAAVVAIALIIAKR